MENITCESHLLVYPFLTGDQVSLICCENALSKPYFLARCSRRGRTAGVLLFLCLLSQTFYRVPLGCTVAFPVKARGLHWCPWGHGSLFSILVLAVMCKMKNKNVSRSPICNIFFFFFLKRGSSAKETIIFGLSEREKVWRPSDVSIYISLLSGNLWRELPWELHSVSKRCFRNQSWTFDIVLCGGASSGNECNRK